MNDTVNECDGMAVASRPETVADSRQKRGQVHFAGTAWKVLCTKCTCPLFCRTTAVRGRARHFTQRSHPERRSGKLTPASSNDPLRDERAQIRSGEVHTRDVVLARAVEAAFSRRS